MFSNNSSSFFGSISVSSSLSSQIGTTNSLGASSLSTASNPSLPTHTQAAAAQTFVNNTAFDNANRRAEAQKAADELNHKFLMGK